ncbi:MAG: aspartate-semialdehyde dehydrogenase [Myxococcota bacterium]|nr:aspartate-semialdehyde dehydrogenase [Myxococcota bacterium]
MERLGIVVLGATGMVGQRIVERLEQHPWLEVRGVAASERSANKAYSDATSWRLPGKRFGGCGDMQVLPCSPEEMPSGVRLVLSAMDGSAAGPIEEAFRAAGFAVVSNAGAHRQDLDVPLVIPEVNPDHLSLVESQPGDGFIVTNPNCSAMPLTMALAPLHAAFGVQAVVASTWQAVSGAGYPGESSWDMVGNVHPHSGNEEAKMAIEPQKILGVPGAPADFVLSARCVRVPVADGHLISAQVRLGGSPSVEEVRSVLEDYRSPAGELPSSPSPLFEFVEDRDRPSPRFDADNGEGMAVTIGRLEPCPVMGVKFFCLAHNTIRGAAGAAVANAELLIARKLVPHSD